MMMYSTILKNGVKQPGYFNLPNGVSIEVFSDWCDNNNADSLYRFGVDVRYKTDGSPYPMFSSLTDGNIYHYDSILPYSPCLPALTNNTLPYQSFLLACFPGPTPIPSPAVRASPSFVIATFVVLCWVFGQQQQQQQL